MTDLWGMSKAATEAKAAAEAKAKAEAEAKAAADKAAAEKAAAEKAAAEAKVVLLANNRQCVFVCVVRVQCVSGNATRRKVKHAQTFPSFPVKRASSLAWF